MTPMSFSDAEYNGKRKRTRREVFLAEMEKVVPWEALLALIEPVYPKAGRVRHPYALRTMLCVHLLQSWFRKLPRSAGASRSSRRRTRSRRLVQSFLSSGVDFCVSSVSAFQCFGFCLEKVTGLQGRETPLLTVPTRPGWLRLSLLA